MVLCSCWKRWVKLCSKLNSCFEKCFMKWSGFVASYPWRVISVTVLISLALTVGFVRFEKQNHKERLYFRENSRATRDLDRADKSFPKKIRPDDFFITISDGTSSVIQNKTLKFAFNLHRKITKEVGLEGSCVPVGEARSCLVVSVLELFRHNTSLLDNDVDIQRTLVKYFKNTTYLMSNGLNLKRNLKEILGKVEIDVNKQTVFASALRVNYIVVFPQDDDTYKRLTAAERSFIDVLFEAREQAEEEGMRLYFQASRSIDDGINESSGGDISLVAVSIILMGVFSVLVLICVRNRVSGHVVLGFTGIMCCILGIGAGFGLIMLSGHHFISFVGTVPFLVLGVGIDDMFIIIDAMDAMPSDVKGKARLVATMKKVGASITMTTLTDIMAFAISSSSDIPAIRTYCLYMMVSILLSYVIMLTVFLAALALDVKRIEAARCDFVCCFKTQDHRFRAWGKSSSAVSRKVFEQFARILMLKSVRAVVVLLSLVLVIAGILGARQVEPKIERKYFVPDGSYTIVHEDKKAEYFPRGFEIDIINDNENFDYTNPNRQKEYLHLGTICKENAYLQTDVISWMSALMNSTIYQNMNATFYHNLDIFLRQNPEYYSDLKFDNKTGRILYSRIRCRDRDVYEWKYRAYAMRQIRLDLEHKSEIDSVFPINLDYFYREVILFLPAETIKNLCLSAAAIMIITSPYLVHPIVIMIVSIGFVTLIIELFGLMAIWNVSLNSVTMITSVMAIGFSVDYSAHVAHSYILASAETPEERMIEALKSIGASVFMGGFSTFLGVAVLAFGNSEMFRMVFKMIFGIVTLGLLNGLVILPVYLSSLIAALLNDLVMLPEYLKVFVRHKINIRHDDVSAERDELLTNNINDVALMSLNSEKSDDHPDDVTT